MRIRRGAPELPDVPSPEGCVGRVRLIATDVFRANGNQNGRELAATLACAGFCQRGQLEPVVLETMKVQGDSSLSRPSRRVWATAVQRVASIATQQAELVCAICPASVLKDIHQLRQAELRAEIAEKLQQQALAAKAASELLAQSSPDVRALLGIDVPQVPLPASEPPQAPPQP
jgi:hypothetical protein